MMEKKELAGVLIGLEEICSETLFHFVEVYFSTGVLLLKLSLSSAREQAENAQRMLKFSKQFFY